MTIEEYLRWPYGKGNAVYPTAQLLERTKDELENDYDRPITYKVYKTRQDHIIFLCKMPSRTKKGIFYDVVIEVNGETLVEHRKMALAKMNFRCFSNSPSFYYTYAKAFKEHDMICDWLWKKYERKVRRKDPDTRNPGMLIGFERTLYTVLYYLEKELHTRNMWDLLQRVPFQSTRDMAKTVLSQDDMEDQYNAAPDTDAVARKKEEAKKRREMIALEKKVIKERARSPRSTPATSTTKNTSHTKTSSKTSKTSKSPKTKKVK